MSVSNSVEILTTPNIQAYDGSSNMCLELALEGERLCKGGDCRAGVAFFQAAIQAGTDDLRTLSAIYSQLGNAYFYLGDYNKAMQYHKHDLTLARTMGDKLGEAKSSGNLGNTFKVMGRFDDAIVCCKRHLELARELRDSLSEGRALYNLGNVFHAKGKHIGRLGYKDLEDFGDDVKECLKQAVSYYEENLNLMKELGDVAAQGRACGNLGNTLYLLGDFAHAILYHEDRLSIARQFGDKPAERRAHSNLGNSHIFMGQFEEAAHHYKRTLALAQELGDHAVEAQAFYSLGNTYTLLRDYETAIEFHLRHLLIAQNLEDRIGEGRACWSLGNAYASLGNHEKALQYANRHLEISKELADSAGEATAKMNVEDLKKILNLPEEVHSDTNNLTEAENHVNSASPKDGEECRSNGSGVAQNSRVQRVKRDSMEQLSLIKLTPDSKQRPPCISFPPPPPSPPVATKQPVPKPRKTKEEEDAFFDLLSRFQSKRMDDQRCSLTVSEGSSNKENRNANNNTPPANNNNNNNSRGQQQIESQIVHTQNLYNNNNNISMVNLNNNIVSHHNEDPDDLIDLIAGMQSKRMDEQRVELPDLPGLQPGSRQRLAESLSNNIPDEGFLDQLIRCQGSRLEDQRSPLPPATSTTQQQQRVDGALEIVGNNNDGGGGGEDGENDNTNAPKKRGGATVPDEDFFSLIMRVQSGRMDDQRAAVPRINQRISNGNIPHDIPNGTVSNSKNSSLGKKKK